ncbi:phosphatidylglycerophosphatase A [Candidatus Curculioniphilus buchneri]|uniref:phosphatidylglycerophosphatase A n=1 Tax=Candidatus Curculioniphilus buchneri TaxID=690594 RepID=UPI00376EB6E9
MKTTLVTKYKIITLTNPWHWIATGFGAGMCPIMPGTVASLVAILLWFFLVLLPWECYLLVVIFIMLLGIYCCHRTACDIGIHDHSCIVLDEFIGIWITLMMISTDHWKYILIGFCLFRFIDIWKPWPIRWLDRNVQGGVGIVIDDVAAGMVSAGILYCAEYYCVLN